MANKYFTQLTNLASGSVAAGDALAIEDVSAAETKYITAADLASYITSGGTFSAILSGRLTTESGVPVSTSDRSAQGTIYWTPLHGNWLPIYDGANFAIKTSAELTLTLNAAAHLSGSVYDIFTALNPSGGAIIIGTGPAWSSGTSRGTGAGTTELEIKNGFYTNKNAIVLKNGATTYSSVTANQATYLGTFYATANAQTTDSGARRMLWSYPGRTPRRAVAALNGSHTYTTGSWRAWNSNTTPGQARYDFVVGIAEHAVSIALVSQYTSVASGSNQVGMSLDSTTTSNAVTTSAFPISTNVMYQATNAVIDTASLLGYHYIQVVEFGTATSNTLTDVTLFAYHLM